MPVLILLTLWIAFCAQLAAQTNANSHYDVIIRGGKLVDGSGAPWKYADLGICGQKICAIGDLSAAKAATEMDAKGQIVAPGFIDIHNHGRTGILQVPTAENFLRQGVTTLLEGQDGSSPLPLRDFQNKLSDLKISVNVGFFVGHGTVRSQVVGLENRAASAAEMARMKDLVSQAMQDGAFGLSTGLYYVPGNFAATEELIELGKVVAKFRGMHISHMRNEAEGVVEGVKETIRIGEEAGIPTQVTHHKIIGVENWGKSKETLRMVTEARARGVDVTIDQYPYTASSTGTAAMFPQWSLAGGAAALKERLQASEQRAKIKRAIAEAIEFARGGGHPKNVQLVSCSFDKSLAGKTLADLLQERGQPVNFQNAAEVAMEIQQKGGCSAVYHAIHERDVLEIMRFPWTMIASDGGISAPGQSEVPHPRNYGTFSRVLGRYVREQNLLPLETAIWKMTGFPAWRLDLKERGLLRIGMMADVVIFDAEKIGDRAEFGSPHQYSVGVRDVLVNGKPVLQQSQITAARPGQILRH
jgi:N-acyl-D-amino-acid deacylase